MTSVYRVLNGQGQTINRIVATTEFMQAHYPDGNYELEEIFTPPVDPAPIRIDTPLFIMRFTPQERVAMRQAAKAENEYAPLIEDWLAILNDPRLAYVELGDPNLIAAMGMMVQLGLLTQERADIVMAP